MRLRSRHQQIIQNLLQGATFVTMQSLADAIGVSQRTIIRDLDGVENWLAKQGMVLDKKKGVGVKLCASDDQLMRIKQRLSEAHETLGYTPLQRQTALKAELLKASEVTKLYTLTGLFDVTESTISGDLDQITPWFRQYGLELIRKPGFGIELTGDELAIRKAIVALLYEHFHETELIHYVMHHPDHTVNDFVSGERHIDGMLLSLLKETDLDSIQVLISKIEGVLGYRLADHAYIGLMIRLMVTIKRIEGGHLISLKASLGDRLLNDKRMLAVKVLLQEALELSESAEDEIMLLLMHVKGAKRRDALQENSISMIDDFKMIRLAKKIIRLAQEALGIYLEQDEQLLLGLVSHLGPAIERLSLQLDVMNPLKDEIKVRYPKLYQVAEKGAKLIEAEAHVRVPDDEIAYIATHIGAAVKSVQRLSKEVRYKIAIACGSGIGTSHLLASEIKRAFESVQIVEMVSGIALDESDLLQKGIDGIISTVPIDSKRVPYIQVNTLLEPEDILAIEQFLSGLTPKQHPYPTYKDGYLRERLSQLESYLKDIREILEGFELIEDLEVLDIQGLIRYISGHLLQADAARSILEREFMAREEKGSTILRRMGMMLLHTRSEVVSRLHVLVVRTKDKLPYETIEGQVHPIDTVVVMVVPMVLKASSLEVLSEISRMIIAGDFANQLKTGSPAAVEGALGQILDSFYQSKVIVHS